MNKFDELVDKFYNGDSLTDVELVTIYNKSCEIVDVLTGTGLLFKTSFKEAIDLKYKTEGFIKSREMSV